MAAALGIPRRGYQRHRRSAALNHYDVPESLRLRAIELGAVPVTWRQMARLTREWRRAGARPDATRSSMMAVEGVVLGRVHRGHALAQQELGVVGRDDAAHDDRGGADPAARSRSSTSGTSSRWEPERMDSPTMSTSSSRAAATIWAGVSRIPW